MNYSNGTMNILWIHWVHDYFGAELTDTHTHTHWHTLTPSDTWFLRSLCRFFFLRFSLFASDEMQFSNCSTWHLVCWFCWLLPCYRKLAPGLVLRRIPGPRHWSLFRVHFFCYWACPTQIFQSVTLPLSAPTSASTSSVSSAEPACQWLVHASLHRNSARNKISFG